MRESVPSGVLTTLLRPAFVAASVAWALLLPLVPFVASRPHATPIGTALIIAAYAVGGAICHQLPERSYHLWAAQMPVCARCAGIYVGAAIGAIVGAASLTGRRANARIPLLVAAGHRFTRADQARAILFIAALPTLATLVYEWTTGHMPAHWIRAATGVPLGATAAWMVFSSMPRRTRAENRVN
jgi:predicted membrane protein DUF2085